MRHGQRPSDGGDKHDDGQARLTRSRPVGPQLLRLGVGRLLRHCRSVRRCGPAGGALAAPIASAAHQAPSASRHDGGGRGSPSATAAQAESGHLNMAMVAVLVGLGLAIGVPIAGRARIANEHSIRRFRGELRNADISELCLEAVEVDRDRVIGREPPSPGATCS